MTPGADGDEGTHGRPGLAGEIATPAGDRAVAPHPAGVVTPGAVTELKEPPGGVALPDTSQPQQATEPLFLTPQVWNAPALTETKEAAGSVGRGVYIGRGVGVGPEKYSSITPKSWLMSMRLAK